MVMRVQSFCEIKIATFTWITSLNFRHKRLEVMFEIRRALIQVQIFSSKLANESNRKEKNRTL